MAPWFLGRYKRNYHHISMRVSRESIPLWLDEKLTTVLPTVVGREEQQILPTS